jgi:hypothetical protein
MIPNDFRLLAPAQVQHQGKRRGWVGWDRSQKGVVSLSDRKLMVKRPRILRKGKGLDREVTILAYESMRTHESLTSIDKNKKVA